MKTKTLILTISVIILSSFSNCVNAQSETNFYSPLMQRVISDKTIDWRLSFPTFKNYTAKEIMQLCEEFGKLYDEEKMSGETVCYITPYLLGALDIRKELDLNALINITDDEKLPWLWRRVAGKVGCGKEFLIPIERIDVNKVYEVYTKIIKNNLENTNLRVGLCSALSSQLAKQYYWIVFPEKMRTRTLRASDVSSFNEIIKTNEKVKAEIIKHDQKIEKYMNFLNEILISKDMPDKLKTIGISYIVHFRGSKTPGLEKIKETLNSLIPTIPDITISEVRSSTSNTIVNVNEKIKNEPSNVVLLKLIKRNLLRREYVSEHFTDQEKRYLQTLDHIDSILADEQN